MDNIKIVFDGGSLYQSKSGSMTAPIYCDFGDYQFPDYYWSDFPAVVIISWINTLNTLTTGSWEYDKFYFFDGDFYVDVRLKNRILTMYCYSDPYSMLVYIANISLHNIIFELIKVKNEILYHCEIRGWVSSDLDELHKCRHLLQNMLLQF